MLSCMLLKHALQRIDLHKVSLEQIWQLIDFDNKGYIESHMHW